MNLSYRVQAPTGKTIKTYYQAIIVNTETTINIIGCGNVGKVLGRLWHEKRVFKIQNIVNRSLKSSRAAVTFIGAGIAVNYDELRPANFYLISANDNNIETCSKALADLGIIRSGDTVFHCSGATSSEILSPLRDQGAKIASIHPVKSFAGDCLNSFEGTFCGCEGNIDAVNFLKDCFHSIGGKTFDIQTENKVFYHAATVIACNYLTALIFQAESVYEKAGISRTQAKEIMQPIVKLTVDNIFASSFREALTGPIARGDNHTVINQLKALTDWNLDYGETYRYLGKICLEIAKEKGTASIKDLETINRLFNKA